MMKTLIAYAGRTGVTAKCARALAIHLNNVTLVDLNAEAVDPADFDGVIIASPVYSHRFERSVKSFLKTYQNVLENKPFACFVTMVEYETFDKVISKEMPETLRSHAVVIENFGGEVNHLNVFGWYDQLIAKSMVQIERKKHPIELLADAPRKFTDQLKKANWI